MKRFHPNICTTLALTLALSTLAPHEAFAAPEVGCNESTARRMERVRACTKSPLGNVRFTRCPPEVCISAARRRAFVSLIDARLGMTLTEVGLQRGIKRLIKTGFFQDVVPLCRVDGARTRLTLSACANTFIRKTSIRGNRFLHRPDIWKRIFLRPGKVLNADPENPFLNEQIRAQAKTIRGLYLKEGLSLGPEDCGPKKKSKDCGIRVTITPTSKTTVALTFQIYELPRQQIRVIRARHRHVGPKQPGKLRCPWVSESNLKRTVAVSVGDVITRRKRSKVERKLKFFFRSIGFKNPAVRFPKTGDSGAFEVEIETKTCWLIRIWERDTAVRSDGVTLFTPDPVTGDKPVRGTRAYRRSLFEPWRKVLPFGNSGNFEADEAARGVNSLRQVLQNRGYLFADVTMNHRRFPSKAEVDTRVAGFIDYYVTKNRKRRIQGITLTGVKAFKPKTIRGLMSTAPYSFFGGPGTLQIGRLFADLKKVMNYYRSRGFFHVGFRDYGTAKDSRPTRTFVRRGNELIWTYTYRGRGFKVRKHEHERVVYLDIGLIEGKQTTLGAISVDNTTPLSKKQVLKLLGLKTGRPFGLTYLNAGIKRLQANYEAKGYYQASLRVACRTNLGKTVNCRRIEELKPEKVDLRLSVNAGRKAVVGEIFWRGNYRTRAGILTRDLPKPGRAYSRQAVSLALRKLRNLGIFNSAEVLTIGLKEKPSRRKVALVIVVEEASARFVDLSAGFRTIDRPETVQGDRVPPIVGSLIGQSISAADRYTTGSNRSFLLTIPDVLLVMTAEYLDKNLFGSAIAMRIPLEYGFSATSPLRLLQTTPSWTLPRVLGSELKLELTTFFIFADRVSLPKDKTEFSARIRATYPFSRRISLTAELASGVRRFQDVNGDPRKGLFGDGEAPFYEPFISTSLRLRFDNQDNPLHPTKGFAISASVSAIIANEVVEQAVESRRFVKWDFSIKGALKIRPGFILALFLRYGGSDATEITPLPDEERFTLGKSNGLRGFGDKSVGRYDVLGRLIRPAPLNRLDIGGNVLINFNLEIRVPLAKKTGIWAVTFFDTGALAADHSQLYLWKSFRSAVGFGIRYLVLNQIPIRIDLGFVLGSVRCESYGEPNAQGNVTCQRKEDRASLQFGFLYPF